MDNKRTKKSQRMAGEVMRLMALENEMQRLAQSDLQPDDGYINPMGRIGTVPPSTYSLGNMLNGTTTQSVINPET